MIRIHAQVGEQQLLSARTMTSAVWLCGHEYSINRRKYLWDR
jgi:hypothetical protein